MTEQEMNRAAATLCGYTVKLWEAVVPSVVILGRAGDFVLCGPSGNAIRDRPGPEESCWRDAPNFSTDRNALPELLAAVTNAGMEYEFEEEIKGDAVIIDPMEILMMEPRVIVECALKACGRWKESGNDE